MKKIILLIIAVVLLTGVVNADVNLEVIAFSCSPDEVVSNNQFSCTATIKNTGGTAGTLNTATLYPDATNWLEDANYPVTVNTNIGSGASTEVSFSNMRPKKTGDNGFSKIMLDDVADTYVADNKITVNVIDVVVTVSSAANSGVSGATVDVTAQATVGGNVDLVLSFSGDSGCGIDQATTVSSNNMNDGQTTSNTWEITIGNSDCDYTISAQATSNPDGSASKTDSSSDTITCTDCAVDEDGEENGGGGGVGGEGEEKANETTTTTTATTTTTTTSTTTTTQPTGVVEGIGKTIKEIFDVWGYIILVVILILVFIGGFFYYEHKHKPEWAKEWS